MILSTFYQRLVDHKQHVNKKQTVEIDSSASNWAQGKYMLASLGVHLRQHCQFWHYLFLLKPIFWERSVKNIGDCHQCRIVTFLKMSVLKRLFGCTVDHEVANRPYHINIYDIHI